MPKTNVNIQRAEVLAVSVDVKLVRNELSFLKSINNQGVSHFYEPHFVSNALRRYEHFWIPFVARLSASEEDDLHFSPPPGNFSENLFWGLCCLVILMACSSKGLGFSRPELLPLSS